jgi:hypothetical protein
MDGRDTLRVVADSLRNYHAFYHCVFPLNYARLSEEDRELLQINAHWIMLMGIENPNLRIVQEMRKLPAAATEKDFLEYVEAPLAAKRDGFWVRTTLMMFWYSITEDELLQFIKVVSSYIKKGIQVVVYPYVQFRPGSELYENYKQGRVSSESISFAQFELPEERRMEVPAFMLPRDAVMRNLAKAVFDEI